MPARAGSRPDGLSQPHLTGRRRLRTAAASTIELMLPVLLGYLTGSVPFAFLMARRAGIDVRFSRKRQRRGRERASHDRRLARRGVMALDVGKGIAAVAIAWVMSGGAALAAVSGAAAVVGHIYPVWLRFHGGKGVAVAAGVFTMLSPLATAIAAGVVSGHGLDHPLRVARVDRRHAGAAAGRVAHRRTAGGRSVGGRECRADSVPSPQQLASASLRHRAPRRGAHVKTTAILGAGSWGTALAVHLARAGHGVRSVGARRRVRRRASRNEGERSLSAGRRAGGRDLADGQSRDRAHRRAIRRRGGAVARAARGGAVVAAASRDRGDRRQYRRRG